MGGRDTQEDSIVMFPFYKPTNGKDPHTTIFEEDGEIKLKADVHVVYSDGTLVGLSVFEKCV
jgi:hypothetical protein